MVRVSKIEKLCTSCYYFERNGEHVTCSRSDMKLAISQTKNYTARVCQYFLRNVRIDKSGAKEPMEITEALDFMTAGQCEFVIQSLATGVCLRYKLKQVKSKYTYHDFIYFVNFLHGAESVYCGRINLVAGDAEDGTGDRFHFSRGKSGCMREDDTEVKAILYVLNSLLAKRYDIKVKVWHIGKCGACGRKLTVIDSIRRGFGPECAKKLGLISDRRRRPRIK